MRGIFEWNGIGSHLTWCCSQSPSRSLRSHLASRWSAIIPRRRSDKMKQSIVHIALVVRDYDEVLEFYTQKLHFTLIEDTYQPEQDKRWVVVAPPGSVETTLLLARASNPEQEAFIGNQSGGRVFYSSRPMTSGETTTTWFQGG